MHSLTVIAAVIVSTAVLVHLARSDPKRRRVFGLPKYGHKRRTKLSLAVLITPGLLLLIAGDAAGFTIWLGALTVTGWGVAAVSPQRSAAIGNAFTRTIGRFGGAALHIKQGIRNIRNIYNVLRDAPGRIDALEIRIDELETELAELKKRQRPDHAA